MFEIFTQLVIRFTSKLFGTSVDLASTSAKDRRSLLTALIQLYDNVVELESASKSAYDAFSEYANGTSFPVVIVARNRIERLIKAVKAFHKQLRIVERALSIQNPNLSLHLGRVGRFKSTTLITLNILSESTPSHEKKHIVSYPTALPLFDLDVSPRSFVDRDAAEVELKKVTKELRKKLKTTQLDLNDAAAVKVALSVAKENIRALEKVRQDLAIYIRDNVPLDSMFV